MNEKQVQRSGDNSQQVQANTVIINNGIEEKRAREIFIEMFNVARKDLTNEAYEIAMDRVTEFENDLIPKVMKIEGAMDAFSDPDFQFLLTNAHKTAAVTERQMDYSLLSELLIHRIQKGSNRKTRAGISRAVEIIDKISDDALLGLTVAFAIERLEPASGSVGKGLNVLNDLFKKLCYGKLPSNNEWLDNLDILDSIRISKLVSLKKFENLYCEKMSGYYATGIKRDSEIYSRVINMLKEALIPVDILITHELHDGYVRLAIVSEQSIDSICFIKTSNVNGKQLSQEVQLSEKQKHLLHEIYRMYDNDENLKQENQKKFCDELTKRPYLCKVREWWNNIPVSFYITAVGRVLADANARRCDESIPHLD